MFLTILRLRGRQPGVRECRMGQASERRLAEKGAGTRANRSGCHRLDFRRCVA